MDPRSYERAEPALTGRQRAQLERIFAVWVTSGVGRVVVPNLVDLERFLPESSMLALLKVLCAGRKRSVSAMASAYQAECHKHVGKGGPALVPSSITLGRAVNRSVFVNTLFETGRAYFPTVSHAEQLVDRLRAGKRLTRAQERLLMSKYFAWATFDASNPGDPFSFLKYHHADEVRAHLGLDPRLPDRLLLLTYSVAASDTVCRPTIADAGLYVFFRPPPPDCREHGLTLPWPTGMLKPPLSDVIDPAPRPEVLHSPIPLQRLEAIKELA